MNIIRKRMRLWVQIITAALTNGYVNGFIQGKIYTGPTKQFCVPGLNCYSCPGAVGACPIGSLQAVISKQGYNFSFYVIGFLMIVGAMAGRFVCGWLCPFGLVQDLLYKIPLMRKIKNLPFDKYLSMLKYFVLVVFVILLPMLVVNLFGQGDPWFCKWICPSGTLFAGIPLVTLNEGLRSAVGWLFQWKLLLLAIILILSIKVYRPFCKYLCPLGAIYGLFNPLSIHRYKVDQEKCVSCKKCQKTCKMDILVYEQPNSMNCIRCQECVKGCPYGAITTHPKRKKRRNDEKF